MVNITTSWLVEEYNKIVKDITGEYPSSDEKMYLKRFCDTKQRSINKKIYYDTLYLIKRWVPLFVVILIIKKKMKRELKKENIPARLVQVSDEFAHFTVDCALKKYCKS